MNFKVALLLNLPFLLVPLGWLVRSISGGYNNTSGTDNGASFIGLVLIITIWAPTAVLAWALLLFSGKDSSLKSKIISVVSILFGVIASWYFVSWIVLGLK